MLLQYKNIKPRDKGKGEKYKRENTASVIPVICNTNKYK